VSHAPHATQGNGLEALDVENPQHHYARTLVASAAQCQAATPAALMEAGLQEEINQSGIKPCNRCC